MTGLFDNSTIRAIINDQQRIGHALAPRHWHTYQPTERQLKVSTVSQGRLNAIKKILLGIEANKIAYLTFGIMRICLRKQGWKLLYHFQIGNKKSYYFCLSALGFYRFKRQSLVKERQRRISLCQNVNTY